MEGSDPQKKLESTYTTALSKNWMVWPLVQATNFKFVPLEHRVLVVNVVSLGMFRTVSIELTLTMSRLELLSKLPQQRRLNTRFRRRRATTNVMRHRSLKDTLHYT